MSDDMEPRELTDDEINALFLSESDGGKYEPIGLFYHWDGNTVTGVDNSTGDAWVEDFHSLGDCIAWLGREGDPDEE